MKLAVTEEQYEFLSGLQSIFGVTVVSDKGLIFMKRDDWNRAITEIDNYADFLHKAETCDVPELVKVIHPYELNLVAYDESEDFSCHAICNYDLFKQYLYLLGINHILWPRQYDMIDMIREWNAHNNNDRLGHSKTWHFIEVEDA